MQLPKQSEKAALAGSRRHCESCPWPDDTWPTTFPKIAQGSLADVIQARRSPPPPLSSCNFCTSSPASPFVIMPFPRSPTARYLAEPPHTLSSRLAMSLSEVVSALPSLGLWAGDIDPVTQRLLSTVYPTDHQQRQRGHVILESRLVSCPCAGLPSSYSRLPALSVWARPSLSCCPNARAASCQAALSRRRPFRGPRLLSHRPKDTV